MEGGAFQDSNVRAELDNWIAIRVDVDKTFDSPEPGRLKTTRYIPELAIVGADGKLVDSANFLTAPQLLQFLKSHR